MKDNYCLGDDSSINFGLARRRKSGRLALLAVLLLIVLAITGGACWFGDQILTEARARHGDAAAQYTFGKRCFNAARTPEERAEAVRLIRTAAEQGNPKAQTALAVIYLNASGVCRDYETGLKWLRAAAAQHFAIAQNELGVMYATGRGLPRDFDAALSWCTRAAVQGSKIARHNLDLIQAAKRNHAAQPTTRDGEVCSNVQIQKVESDGVMVAFQPAQGGIGLAKFKTSNLPDELQRLCGYTAKAPSKLSALLHLESVTSML